MTIDYHLTRLDIWRSRAANLLAGNFDSITGSRATDVAGASVFAERALAYVNSGRELDPAIVELYNDFANEILLQCVRHLFAERSTMISSDVLPYTLQLQPLADLGIYKIDSKLRPGAGQRGRSKRTHVTLVRTDKGTAVWRHLQKEQKDKP